MAVDLLGHILSTEDYINAVARLDNASNAKDLLDFLLMVLEHRFTVSDRYSSRVVLFKHHRRFMLEVFSRMRMVPSLNVPHDPNSYTLPLLLYMLRHRDLKVRHSTGPAMYYT